MIRPLTSKNIRTAFIVFGVVLSGCNNTDDLAAHACISKVEERLAAPSTLKIRWSGSRNVGPVSERDMLARARFQIASEEAKFDELSFSDRIYLAQLKKWLRTDPKSLYINEDMRVNSRYVFVEYDAQNRMGVPLRSFHECRFAVSDDGRRVLLMMDNELSLAKGRNIKSQLES